METLLEGYYDSVDPASMEESIHHNRHVEEDFLATETRGHLLVNDVDKLRSLVRAGPSGRYLKLLMIWTLCHNARILTRICMLLVLLRHSLDSMRWMMMIIMIMMMSY